MTHKILSSAAAGALVAVVAGVLAPGSMAASTAAASANAGAADAFRCPAENRLTASVTLTAVRGRKLRVMTTVAPITSIVANVAGDRAEVRGIVPEGTNSHTFEPKPSVAKDLSRADVLFVNGLKLEDPTQELAAANLPKSSSIVEMGNITITPEQYLYDFSFPEDGGKPNPHLWTNPPMAACYTRIASAVLRKADPANAAAYTANATKYIAKVDELDRLMKAATATVPAANRKLLTYHDAYAYFAKHYGWTVVGAIQVSSFEDPTPKEVANLITQVKRERVPAIFGSEVFPSRVLEQIGREAKVRYVDKLRDDDLPGAPGAADHSFLGLMKFNFVTMVDALGGNSTGLKAFNPNDVVPDRASYPQ